MARPMRSPTPIGSRTPPFHVGVGEEREGERGGKERGGAAPLCWCTKVWVLLYPLLVHGQSQPHPRQGLARQRKTKPEDYEDRYSKNKGGEPR